MQKTLCFSDYAIWGERWITTFIFFFFKKVGLPSPWLEPLSFELLNYHYRNLCFWRCHQRLVIAVSGQATVTDYHRLCGLWIGQVYLVTGLETVRAKFKEAADLVSVKTLSSSQSTSGCVLTELKAEGLFLSPLCKDDNPFIKTPAFMIESPPKAPTCKYHYID